MSVVVYKWGGIAFEDKSLIKTLFLPSVGTNITFHDEVGDDYQVPVGKVFIVGFLGALIRNKSTTTWRNIKIGESDTANAALTKDIIGFGMPTSSLLPPQNVMGVFSAGKYVTAYTSDSTNCPVPRGTALYGVEIPA